MKSLTENKIILVKRQTRLEELIARFNILEQAKFYIEQMGADFNDYVIENQNYQTALKYTETTLKNYGKLQVVDRAFLSNFIFGKNDTVVVLGQDGLVVNTAKYLDNQPIVGVNPDPSRWDGVLLPFKKEALNKIIPEVFNNKRKIKLVTMAKTELNDGQVLHAVNDFFVGQKTHVSARYIIKSGNRQEQHSSSGIIISTGLGSTGWFASIITGANNIAAEWTGHKPELPQKTSFPWDSEFLYFSVREPFPSRITSTTLVFGKITGKKKLILTSLMPENGVIFSDGVESDFLAFNSGTIATVSVAEKKAHLII